MSLSIKQIIKLKDRNNLLFKRIPIFLSLLHSSWPTWKGVGTRFSFLHYCSHFILTNSYPLKQNLKKYKTDIWLK